MDSRSLAPEMSNFDCLPGRAGGSPFSLAGYEAMAMIRRGRVRKIDGTDIWFQAAFIARAVCGCRLMRPTLASL